MVALSGVFPVRYLPRAGAADFLTTLTGRAWRPQALADMASDGVGPPYGIVRGRALYEVAALEQWVAEEMARTGPKKASREHSEAA